MENIIWRHNWLFSIKIVFYFTICFLLAKTIYKCNRVRHFKENRTENRPFLLITEKLFKCYIVLSIIKLYPSKICYFKVVCIYSWKLWSIKYILFNLWIISISSLIINRRIFFTYIYFSPWVVNKKNNLPFSSNH
jgi:hypothetical protein